MTTRTTRVAFAAASAVAAAALLSACEAGSPDEVDNETETITESGEPNTGSILGWVDVDGVEYEITELRNCEPLNDGTIERELELQGFGEVDGDRVQIDVYVGTIGGAPFDDVAWNGPEGVFGDPGQADVTLDANRVAGSATLVDSLTQTETVAIEFDLEVPTELVACR